jgi:hypothetical protein
MTKRINAPMGLGKWLNDKLGDYLLKDSGYKRAYLCDFDRIGHELRPGDVLLMEGHNRVSRIVKRITQSPWTHASLYIGRLHDIQDPKLRAQIRKYYRGAIGDQLIFESMVGKGNYIDNLKMYDGHHIRICRPSGISHADVQKVIAFTLNQLGKEYSIRHFVDLGRFLLGSHLIPKRWRSSLFAKKQTQATDDICSSMIAKAFISVKFPVLPLVRKNDDDALEFIHRNSNLFAPCDFDYSPYFNIIKYPIFAVNDSAPYRHLPWNEDIISNDTEGTSPFHPKDTHTDTN